MPCVVLNTLIHGILKSMNFAQALLTYSGVLAIEARLTLPPNFFYCPCVFNVTFLMINDHQ